MQVHKKSISHCRNYLRCYGGNAI